MFKIKKRNSPGNEDNHYKGDIQHTEFSLEARLNALEHNIVKYMCRYKDKGSPLLDLRKILWHIETLSDYIDHYQRYKYILNTYMTRKVVYEGDLWGSFIRSQKLSDTEIKILENSLFWTLDDGLSLDKAKSLLVQLMEEYAATTDSRP